MKCFIHLGEEAISVCKRCGKAMCANCSAYSGHSGICPECRRDEYINERGRLESELRKNKSSIVVSIILAVIIAVIAIILAVKLGAFFAILLIGTGIFLVRLIVLFNRRKPIAKRVEYLTGEINKLSGALNKGVANI